MLIRAVFLGAILFSGMAQAQADLSVVSIDTALVVTNSQSLQISGVLRAVISNTGTIATTSRFRLLAFEDTNRNGQYDPNLDKILGSVEYGDPIATGSTPLVSIPLTGSVTFRGNLIYVLADSEGSIPEITKSNNLRSTGDSSQYKPPVGQFSPTLKWSWTGSSTLPTYRQVMVMPAVAYLKDNNGDGKINSDDIPYVIFASTDDANDRVTNVDRGVIRALDGRNGSELFSISDPTLRVAPYATLAVADLDGDGIPEIVAPSNTQLLIFRNDGTLKYRSDTIGQSVLVGSVSIADLDGDGKAELIWGSNIFDNQGRLIHTAPACGYGNTWGPNSFAADLDGDGIPEIIDGGAVYNRDGTRRFCYTPGWSAVANLDSDPKAEIVAVYSGVVYALNSDGSLRWQANIPGGGTGGAPTIADFDGDGKPDIGVAGASRYAVFSSTGVLKWSFPTSDYSSAFTGASVFDFDGDGKAEVVYNDEYKLRILDGATGNLLWQTNNPNCTGTEYPSIVDVDKDQHADIIVSRNTFCGLAASEGITTAGIFVYSDPRWVNTRNIWNQHAYNITNVNDDGSIPRHPLQNWLVPGLNNFRQNTFPKPSDATAAPDFISSFIRLDSTSFPSSARLTARLGNGGSKAGTVAATLAFYRGDPLSGGTLIGRTRASHPLLPGEFEDVVITWTSPPAGLQNVFAVADDLSEVNEGDETNNKSATQVLLGSGPFPLVDELLTRQKDSSVDLSWIAIPGAASYNIYRRTSTTTAQLIRSNQTSISFTDTSLTNGTPVFYSVRWLNAQGKESADGTEASATPTPTGATGANTPTILSRAATRAVVGQAYSYQFRATDPDAGTVLAYSLVSPPAGMAISAAGLITWTPSAAQAGYSRIQVRVEDNTGRYATQAFSLFAEIQTIINNPPVITSTPLRMGTSGSLYAYQVVGSDPDGGFLSWSLDAAPLGMSINQATGLIQWLPTRNQVGIQTVTSRTTDIGGLSAIQAFTLTVARGNLAPAFLGSPLTIARAVEQYQFTATATDPDGDPLTYSVVGGPSGMTITANTGFVTWTPPASAARTSVSVTLRVADDGGLTATQTYTLQVTPPNQPPVITSTAVTQAVAGSIYTYQITAADPDLPSDHLNYSLTTAPSGMSIDGNTGVIQWQPALSSARTSLNVTVRVSDLGGLQATQSFVIQVGPAGSDLPLVSLTSPVNGANLTADTPLVGTVTDPNLRLWRVEYQRTGDPDWYPISSGTTAVTNGLLGTLPATLLANDAYRLRLYAENTTGSVTTPDIGANVDTKQLKMGDFTLAFEDLRVPAFTFPISIMRKYDSKRPQSGDFGRGWTLGFSEVDVRLDSNGNAFLTLPDARRVSFTYAPDCISPLFGACAFGAYKTVFTAQNGVYDKLESLDCPNTVFGGCTLGGSFNPLRWLLTTREGLKYTIDNGKITQIEDRSGNWIQIAPTGVTSNTGRNVAIERNLQGLVTKIKEPAPGAEMRYEYDAQGRLVRWINLSGKTTTYFYENAGFPHYLTKIVDPLGRNALRNVFNTEGRLIAQCDAAGDIVTLAGCSQFNPQPGTKTFTGINGRGFKAELVTDDRGNVITERRYLDATNHLDTIRTYDASNNTLSERDPEGNLRTFTYDGRGNRLTEADSGGRITSYTYAVGCDKVETVRDPAGNVTRNTYDAHCNLRFVQDPLLKTTEYQYNAFSQRTRMIDPNGTTWTWTYLSNGLLQNVVDPFGKATNFSFDSQGNLLSRTDRNGRRIDFQYDASNRLTQETWDNGRVSTFAYDALGALVTAADPDSNLTMVYDNLGRLQSVDNLTTPGVPRVLITYTYDANGNVARAQDSLGGSTDYSYDALDRLSRVTQSGSGVQPKRVDMSYSPASLLIQIKRFSDLSGTIGVSNTNYDYDCGGCAGRLIAIRHRKASDNSVIHDMTFVRDPLGNILGSTDAEGTHSYGYDPVRRLTSVTHPANGVQPNEFYTYDAVGNRLTSHFSHLYIYSWQMQGEGDRLLRDDHFDYIYNNEGNLTRKVDRATGAYMDFEYDYRYRMTSAIQKTSAGVETSHSEYTYDAIDRRIHITEGGLHSFVIYEGPNPILELNSLGSVLIRRTYGRKPDAALAEQVNQQTQWLLLDQVGSSRDIISNTAEVLNHYSYDAFGRILAKANVVFGTKLFFNAREVDSSGFSYFRARQYDPFNGRFNREDPLKPFGYVALSANPGLNVDPLGLDFISYDTQLAIAQASIPTLKFLGAQLAGCAVDALQANNYIAPPIGTFLKFSFLFLNLPTDAIDGVFFGAGVGIDILTTLRKSCSEIHRLF